MTNDIDNLEVFDVTKVFEILFLKKYLILLCSAVFFLFGIIYSLSLDDRYKSSAFLQVNSEEMESNASILSSFASGFGGMGFAGISSSANRSDYAVALINSRQFIESLSNIGTIKVNLLATKEYDKQSKKIIYDNNIYDSKENKFIDEYQNYDFALKKIFEVIAKDLEVIKDNKTQFISISFTHHSPIFAKEFLETLLGELNELVRAKELKRSISSIEYLKKISENTSNNEVLVAISQLIETELKKQMLANISKNYLLDPIDVPNKPIKKSEPKRSTISIIFGFIGFLISSLYFIIVSLRTRESEI